MDFSLVSREFKLESGHVVCCMLPVAFSTSHDNPTIRQSNHVKHDAQPKYVVS